MHETTRSTCYTEALELAFVEPVCMSLSTMRLGIELHLWGLSLSNTADVLENFGVDRCRTAVQVSSTISKQSSESNELGC